MGNNKRHHIPRQVGYGVAFFDVAAAKDNGLLQVPFVDGKDICQRGVLLVVFASPDGDGNDGFPSWMRKSASPKLLPGSSAGQNRWHAVAGQTDFPGCFLD